MSKTNQHNILGRLVTSAIRGKEGARTLFSPLNTDQATCRMQKSTCIHTYIHDRRDDVQTEEGGMYSRASDSTLLQESLEQETDVWAKARRRGVKVIPDKLDSEIKAHQRS